MSKENYIVINIASRVPKYKQIISSITQGIKDQKLKEGDKIISINHLSAKYELSRDTVKKAYKYLTENNILSSVPGKGFYVSRVDWTEQSKVLFLIHRLDPYKVQLFDAFVNAVDRNTTKVDIEIYYEDAHTLLEILLTNSRHYDFFVVMPHFKNQRNQYIECPENILESIQVISQDKLIIVDRDIEGLSPLVPRVCLDLKNDIYRSLMEGFEKIKKYNKVTIVYRNRGLDSYPKEVLIGFKAFCQQNDLVYDIKANIGNDCILQSGELYFILEDKEMISLIKMIKEQSLSIGVDIGVISLNDNVYKELLGISVITADYKKMGTIAAQVLANKNISILKNDFRFIGRMST